MSMPLITPKPLEERKIQFRVRLHSSVCQEIDEYCKWAGIKSRDYFLEQACAYIFSQDKEWYHHKQKLAQHEDK